MTPSSRHGATPGRTCPNTRTSSGATPEPKKSYDVVIVGGGGHGLATALLPGQEPRHHQRRRAGEGLAGRRQHGPQHHHHPVQLPVGRERRHLRALAQAVGGPGQRARLPDPVQPARRAQPRAQPAGRPRQRPPGRGQPAQRRRRRVGRRPTRSRSSARSSTSPPTCATRCSARPTSRGPGSPSTTTSPGGSPARADELGIDLIQNCEVTGFDTDGDRVTGVRTTRGDHRRRAGRALRGRAHLVAGRHARIRTAHPVPPAAGAGLRAARAGAPDRGDVQRRARLRLPGAQGRARDGRRRRRLQRVRPTRRVPHHRAADGRGASSCSRSSPGRTCCAPGPASSTSPPTPPRSSGCTPVEDLYLNCGWGTGGFKATPGIGLVSAPTPSPTTSRTRLRRPVHPRPVHHRRPGRRARRRRRRPLTHRLHEYRSQHDATHRHARGADRARRPSSTTAAKPTSPTPRTRRR